MQVHHSAIQDHRWAPSGCPLTAAVVEYLPFHSLPFPTPTPTSTHLSLHLIFAMYRIQTSSRHPRHVSCGITLAMCRRPVQPFRPLMASHPEQRSIQISNVRFVRPWIRLPAPPFPTEARPPGTDHSPEYMYLSGTKSSCQHNPQSTTVCPSGCAGPSGCIQCSSSDWECNRPAPNHIAINIHHAPHSVPRCVRVCGARIPPPLPLHLIFAVPHCLRWF